MVVKVDVDEMEQDNMNSIIDFKCKRLSEIHHSCLHENIIHRSNVHACQEIYQRIFLLQNMCEYSLDIIGAYTESKQYTLRMWITIRWLTLRTKQILFGKWSKGKMMNSKRKKKWNKTMEKSEKYSKAYENVYRNMAEQ